MESVNVIPVYWSTNVNYASSITSFYCALAKNNSYFKILLQYATTISGSLQSLWYGQCGTAYTDNQPSTGTVTEAQVVARLKALFALGALPAPGPNNYYPVHFPPGVTVLDSSNTASCVTWCAYHNTDTYNGQYMMYGIIPDQVCGVCVVEGVCLTWL